MATRFLAQLIWVDQDTPAEVENNDKNLGEGWRKC